MRKQAGFVLYALLGALLVIGALTVWQRVTQARLDAVRSEYAGFQAQVKSAGEAQIARNKAKDAENKAITARLDNENKYLHAKLADAARRLRDRASSGSGGVPQIPKPASGTDEATINVADANRALREYFTGARGRDAEIAGLIIEGAQGVADLDTGKAWVKEQMAVK